MRLLMRIVLRPAVCGSKRWQNVRKASRPFPAAVFEARLKVLEIGVGDLIGCTVFRPVHHNAGVAPETGADVIPELLEPN